MAIILAMRLKQTGGFLKLCRTTGKLRDPNPRPIFELIAFSRRLSSRAHARIASEFRERLRSVDVGFSLRIYTTQEVIYSSHPLYSYQ